MVWLKQSIDRTHNIQTKNANRKIKLDIGFRQYTDL